jgi:hypothetical protein
MVGNVFVEACPSTEKRSTANLEMPGYAHLCHHDRAATNFRTATETGLRSNGDIWPEFTAVSDLNQVVELYAVTNFGLRQGRAVDRGVGADFDVVAHDHNAHLWNFVKRARGFGYEPKTISSDHRSRLQHNTVAENAPFANHHAGMHDTAFTDNNVSVERGIGMKLRARAHFAPRADNSARRDPSTFMHFGVRTDMGSRLDAGRLNFRCADQFDCTCKIERRV